MFLEKSEIHTASYLSSEHANGSEEVILNQGLQFQRL